LDNHDDKINCSEIQICKVRKHEVYLYEQNGKCNNEECEHYKKKCVVLTKKM
jgi:hypothetical protein